MKNLSKRDYSILIGSAVDHFDTALYSFLAPIFAQLFFPTSDPIISLILAYSVLATTIITRPLGSYIFGLIALTSGPAVSLSYSLIGVGITTLVLGFLPTYNQIGVYAPIFLIILRFFSGTFSAGEISIAKLYILAEKKKSEALKSSYLYQTSVMLGIVFASFASTIALNRQESIYWRMCFVIGGITALFGYILRIYKTEKLPLNIKQTLSLYSIGTVKTLWDNKGSLLRVAITSGFSYATYSVPFIIMNNLIPEFTGFTLENMMTSNTILLIMDMILLPVIGTFLFKFEIKNLLLFTAGIMAITIIPIWYPIETSSFAYIISIKIWIILIGVVFSDVINLWYETIIHKPEKYLIVGIGYSIGTAIIGKMAPAICLGLYHYTKSPFVIGWFMFIISLATILAIAWPYYNDKAKI